MKPIAVVLIALLASWTLFSAPTGAKKKPAPKSASKSSAKNTSSKKTVAKRTTGKASTRKATTKSSRYARGRYAAPPRPRVQSEPTPDRYREIQQALQQKGYLAGEPTGQWDAGSMDALKRFQQDQNLNASGKLDSLSLIALGLGPQRTNTSAQARPQ